jgi:exopolysaccharide biosynthesis polyprenyl glycosylphosphotransferase
MEELIESTVVKRVQLVGSPEAIQGADMLEQLNSGDTVALGAAAAPGEVLAHPGLKSLIREEAQKRWIGPRLVLLLSDLIALALCEYLALLIVQQPGSGQNRTMANILLSVPLFIIVVISLSINNGYATSPSQVLKNSFTELHDIVYALGVAGCVVLGIDHLFGSLERQATIEPITIVVALLLAAAALPTARGLSRAMVRFVAVEQLRVLVVGSGMMARYLLRYLSWDARITIVGCVDDDPVPGTSVLGGIDDLARLCDELAVDQVIVGFSRTHPQEAILRLQSLNDRVAISIVPRYFELLTWRSGVKEIAGLALIDVAPARLNLGSRIAKRTCDLVIGSTLLIFSILPLAIAAIAIKATSPGPVLFRQQRIGKGGKPFVVYKLRTMTINAEHQQADLAAERKVDGLFKLEADPRITRVGRFLRRSSLDEVPQLWNVLKGDMALVGPRPFVASESSSINGFAQRRFEVRPGLTGLWQVSGRSNLTFDELQRLDYLYVASWSLWWDLRILWNTPARVLRGHGAY